MPGAVFADVCVSCRAEMRRYLSECQIEKFAQELGTAGFGRGVPTDRDKKLHETMAPNY